MIIGFLFIAFVGILTAGTLVDQVVAYRRQNEDLGFYLGENPNQVIMRA